MRDSAGEATGWTIDELVRRAGLALAGSALAGHYAGAPNGRIREVPDQRLIRWYTSIGLVDRPFGGRGRGARYGVRHLRQIVAVKLLQGQGLPLAEIQARLAGVADPELAFLAPLSEESLAEQSLAEESPADGALGEESLAPGQEPASPGPSRRFWAVTAGADRRPVRASTAADPPTAEPMGGVRLAPEVLLVLPATPGPEHLEALAVAAQPLLAALRERGLISRSASLAGPTQGATP